MLETKKYNIIEWIISLADEKVIDAIQSIKDKVETSSPSRKNPSTPKFSSSTYNEIKNRKVDINQLKKEQNVKSISPKELKAIALEADIKESIDDLLIDLKNLG